MRLSVGKFDMQQFWIEGDFAQIQENAIRINGLEKSACSRRRSCISIRLQMISREFTMNKRIQNILAGAIVAVSAVCGGMGAAQAAVVTGDFDPMFGNPFGPGVDGSGLYWKGSVTVDVPDYCLTGPAIGAYNVLKGACNAMHMVSAQVSLFNGQPTGSSFAIESLTFTPNNLFSFALNTVRVTNGKITGIATDYSYAVLTDESSLYGINNYRFALGFSLDDVTTVGDDFNVGGPSLLAIKKSGNNLFFLANDIAIAAGGTYPSWVIGLDQSYYKNTVISKALQAGGGSDYVADLRSYSSSFSGGEVPEPGSLILILAGLTALRISARRRSR